METGDFSGTDRMVSPVLLSHQGRIKTTVVLVIRKLQLWLFYNMTAMIQPLLK